MDVAAHILGSAAFFMFWGLRPIVCMGHKGGGLASLRSPTGLWVLRTGGIRLDKGWIAASPQI